MQVFLIAASLLITHSSATSLQAKLGLPFFNRWAGWAVLGTISSSECYAMQLSWGISDCIGRTVLSADGTRSTWLQDSDALPRLFGLLRYPLYQRGGTLLLFIRRDARSVDGCRSRTKAAYCTAREAGAEKSRITPG